MSVGSVSFWRQNQNWYAGQGNANSNFFNSGSGLFGSTSASSLFSAANPSSSSSLTSALNSAGNLTSVLSLQAANSGISQTDAAINFQTAAIGAMDSVATNYATNSALLAAQQASNRTTAAKQGTPPPAPLGGNINNQVSVQGSLAGLVNFGAAGPAVTGGYQFLSGSSLTNAFKTAMAGRTSGGSAIDSVTVVGKTLVAATSGTDAHPVFTLALQPDTGTYTFTLINPIDGVANKTTGVVSTLNLSGLIEGATSAGKTLALPNKATISVYGTQHFAKQNGAAGSVYQSGLVYTPPPAAPAKNVVIKQPPYTPPINPATGYAYVAPQVGAGLNLVA